MIVSPSRNKTKLLPFCIKYSHTSAGVRSSLLDAYELALKSSLFFSEVQSVKGPNMSTVFNASYLKYSRFWRLGTKQHSTPPVSRLDKRMVILWQKKHLANIPTSKTNICKQFRVNTAKLNISREMSPPLHSAYRELKNKTFQPTMSVGLTCITGKWILS